MTADRDLDTQVRTWLEEPPAGPPDRDAVFTRVRDRLPDTPQRRPRWLWPFDGHLPGAAAARHAGTPGVTTRGRVMQMFSATRVLMATTVLALSGVALFSLVSSERDVSAPPGAAGAALDEPWLSVLNEPGSTKMEMDDLAAAAFTEDATLALVWRADDIEVLQGRDAITRKFRDIMQASRTEPLIELPAVDGEERFVGIYDFQWGTSATWPGTVCGAWARDERIYRLDCLFPEMRYDGQRVDP
jgi:hypothetical protein